MRATFDHAEDNAANIRTFYFTSDRSVHYMAGQFTELTLPHDNPDERGIKRWFTLSSSPTEKLLTITTKYAGDKSSSFKKALWALEPGTEVHLADPMGDFVLPKDPSIPLVFVAGGIGLTPFHSIFSWLADTGDWRNIQFIYAVDNENEIIFQDTFKKIDLHATIVVSHASAEWGGERGRITAQEIIGLTKPSEDSLIYVSGPEPMVESLHKDLKAAGIKNSQLVGDYFPNYSAI